MRSRRKHRMQSQVHKLDLEIKLITTADIPFFLDSGSNFCKSFRVYAGVLEPDDVDHSEDEDVDALEDNGEENEPQPVELFPILEEEGSDIRLPPHMRCAVHR